MFFSLEARFGNVAEALRRIEPALESGRGGGKMVGPLAELRGLRGGGTQAILSVLPNVADYEAFIVGDGPLMDPSRNAALVPNRSYDSLATYLGDWGAVILEYGTSRYSSRIRVDFTAPRDPRDSDRAIPFERLLGTESRSRVLAAVISACLVREAPPSLVRELGAASGAKHGFRPFRDESGLLECEILVRDDSAGVNHSVSLRPLSGDILGAYIAAVGSVREANGWRMTLYGNKERMQAVLDKWPELGVSLSFGNTIAGSEQLLVLEEQNHDAWWAELKLSTLSEAAVRELLSREDQAELYERMAIKWMGLRDVLGKGRHADSGAWLEIVRSKGRGAQVYVFVDDELASRSMKSTLEGWIGGRLKRVDL